MPNKLRSILRTKNLTGLICVLFILAATLGCKRLAELANKNKNDNSTPVAEKTPPATGDAKSGGDELTKKTNLYISECLNKYSNRVIESFNRYSQWVKDPVQGPTGREQNIYGLYDVTGDGSDCEQAVENANSLEPDMPDIESDAERYVAALKSVIGQIRGVYKYYEQEDYKDDNFAKGKEANAALVQSFKEFRDANTDFSGRVDELEDQVASEQLERLRGVSGKHYDFLVVESGIKAKKIKNLLQDKTFDEITADELSPLIDDFEKTVESLRGESSKNPMAGLYISACDEFTKASKEMMRRKRDKQPFSESEKRTISMGAGWMVDGSPAKIIRAYNDMISRRRLSRM